MCCLRKELKKLCRWRITFKNFVNIIYKIRFAFQDLYFADHVKDMTNIRGMFPEYGETWWNHMKQGGESVLRPAHDSCLRHRPCVYKRERTVKPAEKQRRYPFGPWRVTFTQNLFSNGPRRLAFTPPASPTELNWVLPEHQHVWVTKRWGSPGGFKMVVVVFFCCCCWAPVEGES